MTLEQINSDLREWDHKLRVTSDNMLELSCSMSYQGLMGVRLSGRTGGSMLSRRIEGRRDGEESNLSNLLLRSPNEIPW